MSIPQSGGGLIESRDQLAEYLASGCKPPDDWRIGTEHEKFGYRLADLKPLPYEGSASIHAVLSALGDRYGWRPVEEAGNIIGLEKDGANVSLEPGGQLELSGAPLRTIHETCDEVNEHLREVKAIADEIGAGFIGLGAAPEWTEAEMPVMPKGRYALMTRYMRQVGSHGTQMMYRTCTVQVNLDFASEADMVKKFRVGLALQPVATALFANSPFFEGKRERLAVLAGADSGRTPTRTGPGCCPSSSRRAWGSSGTWTMRSTCRCTSSTATGATSTRWGRASATSSTAGCRRCRARSRRCSDWADHLTTIFPEVRLKKFMEMRGADGGSVAADLRVAGVLGGAPLRPGFARRRLGSLPRLDGGGARRAAPRCRQARAASRDPWPVAARGGRRGRRHRRGRACGRGRGRGPGG